MKNISFKHSGRLGDIIYALPLIKVMVEKKSCKADFYIISDDFYEIKGAAFHPGQGVTVSQGLFDYIFPLLERLEYINKVVYCRKDDVSVDYVDLDSFKNQNFNLLASGNQIWYRKAYSIPVPFEEKWITWKVQANLTEVASFNVLVNKSTRFYNKSINYQFLDEIDNVGFFGLEMEYEDFKKRNNLTKLQYVATKTALDVAQLLSRCNLFIGNQSLGFAIAEGLKIPRAVEVFEPAPVVIPIGGVCIEYLKTEQLIKFLTENFAMKFTGCYEDKDGGFVECVINERPPKLSRRIKNLWRKLRNKSLK